MKEELDVLIKCLPTSEFKTKLCAEIATLEFENCKCKQALQIIASGELTDGDAVNMSTMMFAEESLADLLCGKVNSGHSCEMPKGSECPDCCGIRDETIGMGD